ncbi:hypothetical protein [Nocardia jiangxiensis]|uniref:Glycine zipper n=1 Tax=Nocardia jiangxiensis TaxID=282685 RepID=A0ABW6SC99_9NOCA|nr:hypothetical protein [Nocardia jiangxiensis]
MKKLNYAVSVATLAVGTIGVITVGSANAAVPVAATPVPDLSTLSVSLAPGVRYAANTQDRSAVLSTPLGTLTTRGGVVQVTDATGRAVVGQKFDTPPKAASDIPAVAATGIPRREADSPIAAQPVLNPAPVQQVDQQADFNAALGQAGAQFGLASGVGAMVGGVTGAAIGCPLGAITGGALMAVAPPVTPLAAIGGCILGAGAMGGVGAILGGALVGGTVGVASAAQMYNTLHAKGEA